MDRPHFPSPLSSVLLAWEAGLCACLGYRERSWFGLLAGDPGCSPSSGSEQHAIHRQVSSRSFSSVGRKSMAYKRDSRATDITPDDVARCKVLRRWGANTGGVLRMLMSQHEGGGVLTTYYVTVSVSYLASNGRLLNALPLFR
jgi:hypothetical protein